MITYSRNAEPFLIDPEEVVALAVGEEAPITTKLRVLQRLIEGALEAAADHLTDDGLAELCRAVDSLLARFTPGQQALAVAYATLVGQSPLTH